MIQKRHWLEESVTYQAILEKGALSEARKFLLRLAKKRLGPPPAEVLTALEAITEVERLEELGESFMDVRNWEQAISLLTVRPRQRKRS